jgi:hypothetical protein
MKRGLALVAVIVALVFLLALPLACGGGGGGGESRSGDDDDDDTIPSTDDDDATPDDDDATPGDDDDTGDDDASPDDDDDDDDDDPTDQFVAHIVTTDGFAIASVADPNDQDIIYMLMQHEGYLGADPKHHLTVLNAATPQIEQTLPLPGRPIDIALDPEGETLWVVIDVEEYVMWIELDDMSTGVVELEGEGASVEVGGNGRVYVPTDFIGIEVLDEHNKSFMAHVEHDPFERISNATHIEIDRDRNLAYVATPDVPSDLQRLDITDNTLTILEAAEHWSLGHSSQDLVLSPDGEMLIFLATDMIGEDDTLPVLNPQDFTDVMAEFNIGRGPKEVVFFPDMSYAVGINQRYGDELLSVVDVNTWDTVKQLDFKPVANDDGRDDDIRHISMDFDGEWLVLCGCDFSYESGHFYMVPVSQLTD